MRKSPALLVLVAAYAVAGCGNYSGLKNQPVKPIAVIDGPGTGPATTTIELDGSNSYDPNALQQRGIFEWEWSLLSTPPGSAATIDSDNGDTGQPLGELDADLAGRYVVRLRVRDINDYVWSDYSNYQLIVFPITGFTVELRWNTNVNDTDLHLIDETAGGSIMMAPEDCFFQNLQPDWGPAGAIGDPVLNPDQVDGFGPETTVLAIPVDGERYHVMVHYFSDDGMSTTTANVKIWVNGDEVLEMDRELSSPQLWDVALIDWMNVDATITTTDTLSAYP